MPSYWCFGAASERMGENSGGKRKGGTLKRNMEVMENSVDEDDYPTINKKREKFLASKRGLFKEYNHIYVEVDKKDYPVLLSPISGEGASPTSMNLLKINNILKTVKGVVYVKAVGRSLVKVFFSNKADANAFILGQAFLKKNNWQAKIPYDHLESQGVIRAPTELTEEELLENLKSSVDIIGVKRFTRKSGDDIVPTPTVLITFLSSTHPDHATYDYMWFDVKSYVKPLKQCFVCYKFGHSRGSCRASQVCSQCAGPHFWKDCDSKGSKKCVNCKGSDHIAVSANCPVKKEKLKIVQDQIKGKITYASMASKTQFPVIKEPLRPARRAVMTDIVNSDQIMNSLMKTVIDILKKKGPQGENISTKVVKELLITNLTS